MNKRLSPYRPFTDHAGLAAYDNGARWLSAALPRFDTPDPKAGDYPHLSPYANRACNPTRFVDPSGEAWVEEGAHNIVWRKDVTAENYKELLKEGETFRGDDYSRLKVWNDANVGGNSESGLMLEHYKPNGKMEYENLTPWMDTAVEELKKNISETGTNPEITKYFKYTQLAGSRAANSDQTPWCAAFVNYCLEISNIERTNNALAYSFIDYGTNLSDITYGAIAIMSYSHVGFVAGVDSNNRIIILGGNQQNAINLSPNPTRLIKKLVYPNGYYPNNIQIPILNISGRSLNFNLTR